MAETTSHCDQKVERLSMERKKMHVTHGAAEACGRTLIEGKHAHAVYETTDLPELPFLKIWAIAHSPLTMTVV
jgi:hypothetical protein